MGFIPGRFIAENGQILYNVQAIAAYNKSESIGLLLDQEKAYDRAHSEYLTQIMHAFNIPSTLIHSLTTLLFNTHIHFNVNGYITTNTAQQRWGLRQGDPLSPLL